MKIPIFLLYSSFEEVQDQSKDQSWSDEQNIYFEFIQNMCRSALRFCAPAVVSHTLIDGYILVNVGGHFHSSHPHTFSLLIWLVRSPWMLFSSHVGNFSKLHFSVFGLGFLQLRWLWSTQCQTDLKLSQNFDFPNPHFLALFPRQNVDFDLVALT